MQYKYRELRRLWEVEVFNGDPNDPEVTTRKETVVALNHVDAIRKVGGHAATLPDPICFVTWPDGKENQIFRIDDPSDGPIGDPIQPSVAVKAQEEDWIAAPVEEVDVPKTKKRSTKKPKNSE